MQKLCSNCPANANYSVVVITSTVGISKRIQRSSVSVPFCAQCFAEFRDRLCSDLLRESVNKMFTAIETQLNERLLVAKTGD